MPCALVFRHMNILHLGTERSWRGGENQILLLMRGLKQNHPQIQCRVAFPRGSRGLERFAEEFPTLELPSTSAFDLRSIFKIAKYCRTHKIDIIDAHSSNAHSLAFWAQKLVDFKLVVHRRVDKPIKNQLLTKKKYYSPRVSQFVAISECIAQILVDYGVDKTKLKVVRSAIDLEKYKNLQNETLKLELKKIHGLADNTVLIGNASALTHEKGYEVLVSALGLLKTQRTDFCCFIAGDGALKNELETLVQALGLEPHIRFLGFISDVPSFLASLDIFAIPSMNEGLGTVLLDAIGAGCAPIGTNVGGIPEIILHEKTGLLIEKGDVKALAQALNRLVDDPKLRKTINDNAQTHVRENFSLANMVEGNYQVYSQIYEIIKKFAFLKEHPKKN
jgi:glycosyltransferase involved in cell wall biosynthesis